MATSSSTSSSTSEEIENIENRIYEVRAKVEVHFSRVIEGLRKRKEELLDTLEDILNIFKKKIHTHNQTISELKQTLQFAQNSIQSESLEQLQHSILNQTRLKLFDFESRFITKHVTVEFDRDCAHKTGSIVITDSTIGVPDQPVVTFRGKSAVVSVGQGRSCEEGLFYDPFGVAVDPTTGNIYVSEHSNHRVQVFDSDGVYLFKFDTNMYYPRSIAIYDDQVFVGQWGGASILVYNLDGTYIKRLGGSPIFSFVRMHGIAINKCNGDIYVCNCGNYSVEIFTKDFVLKGSIAINNPCDIKLTDEYIYVLCYHFPFIQSFTYSFTEVCSTVLRSISKHLSSPRGLCIDGSGHFFITDNDKNAILIFNQKGSLVHMISHSIGEPNGIALNPQGRIIVVGYNQRILIF